MTHGMHTNRRLAGRLATALILAAIAVPAAQAQPPHTYHAHVGGPGLGLPATAEVTELPDGYLGGPGVVGPGQPAADTVVGGPGTGLPPVAAVPTSVVGGPGYGMTPARSFEPVATPVADGFNWRDAGVGAAVAAGGALLLAAAALVLGRRRGSLAGI